VNIIRTVARRSSNRLKLCWLKIICCICISNELECEIQHQTGRPSRGPAKNLGAMSHPGPPLEPPLGNTRTKQNQLSAIIWNFYDAKKQCHISPTLGPPKCLQGPVEFIVYPQHETSFDSEIQTKKVLKRKFRKQLGRLSIISLNSKDKEKAYEGHC